MKCEDCGAEVPASILAEIRMGLIERPTDARVRIIDKPEGRWSVGIDGRWWCGPCLKKDTPQVAR